MKHIILAIATLFLTTTALAEIVNPKTTEDFYRTSVKVYGANGRSGGTGSIFKSFNKASHILTNKHVCRLIEQGGFVSYKGKKYPVTHYKKFTEHDLCLVRIETNLNIELAISGTLLNVSQTVMVSGHPNLLPHILTKGHASEDLDINLVVGIKKCTKEDKKKDASVCFWFGGKPVIKTMAATVVSNLIKPGSSGSGVFNEKGELVGVVYAGNGRGFSHGFIVPHLFVLYFIKNVQHFKWVKVGTKVDDRGFIDRIFNYTMCEKALLSPTAEYTTVVDFCKSIKDNVIWRQ